MAGVKEYCYFLKDMEGAKKIRQRINNCFELASLPDTTPEERKKLLTFVIVSPACRSTLFAAHSRRQQIHIWLIYTPGIILGILTLCRPPRLRCNLQESPSR